MIAEEIQKSHQPRDGRDDVAPVAVIAGTGLLTPLGESAPQTWRALLDGRYITEHSRAAGEYDPASPRVVQMARRVADEALAQAGWDSDESYATVVGTSKGSVESWLPTGVAQPLSRSACGARPDASPPVAGLADIAAALDGRGPRLTVSAACASGLLALIRGAMMIRGGEVRRVLVVAAEASVHPLFVGSFARLGVLPAPGIGCRPFDRNRDGFLMSEAAAAVCLEASSSQMRQGGATANNASQQDPTNVRVAVDRFACGGDASHLTASDPGGATLRYLINKVCDQDPIDLIHAHGTGTPTNDPIELAALEHAFENASSAPCLYSHKGALGHSLGAAGLIAVVLNVLSHTHGLVLPNVRTADPLPTRFVSLHHGSHRRPVRRSLALAAGFGGASAAIGLVTI